jgi:beta-glucosidase
MILSDIQSLIDRMTLEEKAALCTGTSNWTTLSIPRLGIPHLLVADGPNGVRRIQDVNAPIHRGLPATCFPTSSCMASTWDTDLLFEVGQALGEECIALEVDVLLAPGVNMKRIPLCGRNFEYYSEDPFLAGKMAVNFINGVQSQGVGTSLKHFAANNQEFERFCINARIDERALREIYLPAFEMAVKEARPWTVMCAYNKLNGVYCSENQDLLVDILKKEWGFEGLVVSDWGAVHDRVAALRGGLDLEMPGPKDRRVKAVVKAVHAGELGQAALDESVRRILKVVFKAAETPKGGDFDADAHHALARRVAAEGMVLLKNNGILPLQNPRQIAVIGQAARKPYFQGEGSSHVTPTRLTNPFEALQKQAAEAVLTYCEGYVSTGDFNQQLIDQAVQAASAADVALLFISLPSRKEAEGYDRADLDFNPQQVALVNAVTKAQPQTVVIINNGSAVVMSEWIDSPAAVLEAWMMGQAGGEAVVDVLYGKVNPSGKLAESFPLKLADTPAYVNYPGENGEVRYGEGIFIGYRYYDAKEMPVLFPFGYGGSYTTFEYSSPKVSSTKFKDIDGLRVSVDVTNTGSVAGKEVVQVYVRDCESKLVRPLKELKGFAKVELQPGETKTVTIALDFRSFAYYHPAYRQWVTEGGEFEIQIGASSADIRFTQTVTLQSTLELPPTLKRESTVRDWLSDPIGKVVVEPLVQKMIERKKTIMQADGRDGETISPEEMDMPLLSILHFSENELPLPADDLVDTLLRQVYQTNKK